MEIDRTAPVVASAEITIAASQEAVWVVMTDAVKWPQWNPDIKSVQVEGPFKEGARFKWRSGPGKIASVVQQMDRPSALAWTGSTMGIEAVHVWRLEPITGGTRVQTEESWSGLVPRLLPGILRGMLRKAIAKGLEHLKVEVEMRARCEAPREGGAQAD